MEILVFWLRKNDSTGVGLSLRNVDLENSGEYAVKCIILGM